MTFGVLVAAARLEIPFPSRISPDLERSRPRHLAWCEARGLWPDTATRTAYEMADFPQFVARTHPWALGADLDLATDLIGWSWLWDDSIDKPRASRIDLAEVSTALDSYRLVLRGDVDRPATKPLLATWGHLLQRLAERTTAQWRSRHEAHWEATFTAFEREAHNNLTSGSGRVPTFSEYLDMRRAAGGMDICLDWIEAISRQELPAELHDCRHLLRLRQHEQDVVAITNDLFSARNEWAAGNTDNIVHVLAQEQDTSWEHAAALAGELISERLNNFADEERALRNSTPYIEAPPEVRENTDRFIDAMKDWMRGSLEWHLQCPRYREPSERSAP